MVAPGALPRCGARGEAALSIRFEPLHRVVANVDRAHSFPPAPAGASSVDAGTLPEVHNGPQIASEPRMATVASKQVADRTIVAQETDAANGDAKNLVLTGRRKGVTVHSIRKLMFAEGPACATSLGVRQPGASINDPPAGGES